MVFVLSSVQIVVVDAMMGMGKTSAAINYMEENCETKRFLFITPYLDEGERIMMACQKCGFVPPPAYGNKQNGLKYLLRNRHNIVSTHALFGMIDTETMELIKDGGYTLVMDEVFDAVTEYDASDCDVDILLRSGVVTADKRGVLEWVDDGSYAGAFNKLKRDMDSRTLVSVRAPPGDDEKGGGGSTLLSIMPTGSFSCFDQIFVLTYLFDGSLLKSYFDLFGFTYRYIGVERSDGGFRFTDSRSMVEAPGLSSLITMWNPSYKSQGNIGTRKGSLSVSWFKNHSASSEQVIGLKKNMRNFFSNVTRSKSADCLWTTFKFAEKKLAGPGYARGFAPHNIRATNKFKDRSAVAYALNKYLSPGVVGFFEQNEVPVGIDHYALSTIIQFIWRSAIRDGKPISLYIPSLRMRLLFENWLKEVSC